MCKKLISEIISWLIAVAIFGMIVFAIYIGAHAGEITLTMYGQHSNGTVRTIGNIVIVEVGDTVHAYSIAQKPGPPEPEPPQGSAPYLSRYNEESEYTSDLMEAQKWEKQKEYGDASWLYEKIGDFDKSEEMAFLNAQQLEATGRFALAAYWFQDAFRTNKAIEMAEKLIERNTGDDMKNAAEIYKSLGMEAEYRETAAKIKTIY